ncbi:MAG: MJ0042-type zinc finger domain-containing protein, partial [Pseudomonadales bacterium]|nr:MJ0042-type zinc finger domain-containing protein [Pseudomonadales bacterium]
MSSFVVACPGCGTQFRVTPAHLAPARGLVRCGACLTVFRAEAMRVDGAPADSAEPAVADGATGSVDGRVDAQTHERPRPHASRHRSVLGREPRTESTPESKRAPESEPSLDDDDVALAELPEDDLRAPPRLDEITLPAEAERVAAALEEQRRARERRPGKRWMALAGVLASLLVLEL